MEVPLSSDMMLATSTKSSQANSRMHGMPQTNETCRVPTNPRPDRRHYTKPEDVPASLEAHSASAFASLISRIPSRNLACSNPTDRPRDGQGWPPAWLSHAFGGQPLPGTQDCRIEGLGVRTRCLRILHRGLKKLKGLELGISTFRSVRCPCKGSSETRN